MTVWYKQMYNYISHSQFAQCHIASLTDTDLISCWKNIAINWSAASDLCLKSLSEAFETTAEGHLESIKAGCNKLLAHDGLLGIFLWRSHVN